MTIAMHRAKPIKIRPTMYSGLSCKKSIARMNIKMGPIIQLRNNDIPKTFVFLNTSFSFSYLTLANGGYIIRINPTAKGMFVVPDEKELMNIEDEGKK
ncbi:hypothetical protein GCM10023229_19460 [Flavisolibacter ginsenosidimutans]